jgi:SAM-dependent methyltransferase
VAGQTFFDSSAPSPFIADWVARLAKTRARGRALDVAMGRGRHGRLLAAAGFETFGVDVKFQAVRDAVAGAAAHGVVIRGWCADLTRWALPEDHFDVVVVCRYLQRDLFPALARALRPDGVLLYETFTETQRSHGRGPTSPAHLLREGELRQLAGSLTPLFYEEVSEPDAVARLAACRAVSRS